jgi:DNA-binding MarR family transcriptional regulator
MTTIQTKIARDMEAIVHGAPEDHKAELRLWLRLLSCTNLISTEVRRRLRTQFDVTLPRFDLLAQLDREKEGLRLGELSKRMMVTNGNVTGLVERLMKEGLIRRGTVDGDRRVGLVTLTRAGRAAFSRMAAAHELWLAELFADLAPADIDLLMKGLAGVRRSVTAHAAAQED